MIIYSIADYHFLLIFVYPQLILGPHIPFSKHFAISIMPVLCGLSKEFIIYK